MTTETSKGVAIVSLAFTTRAGTFLTLEQAQKELRLKIVKEFVAEHWPVDPSDTGPSWERRHREHMAVTLIADHFEDIINLFKAEGVY